jgi:alpha-galactosidase
MRNTCGSWLVAALSGLFILTASGYAQTKTITLAELDLSRMTSGWGKPAANRSIVGNKLSLGGRTFERGIGTHAESEWSVQLDGKADEFSALVGVDDEVKPGQPGSVEFLAYVDAREAWRSGVMKAGQAPKEVKV